MSFRNKKFRLVGWDRPEKEKGETKGKNYEEEKRMKENIKKALKNKGEKTQPTNRNFLFLNDT